MREMGDRRWKMGGVVVKVKVKENWKAECGKRKKASQEIGDRS